MTSVIFAFNSAIKLKQKKIPYSTAFIPILKTQMATEPLVDMILLVKVKVASVLTNLKQKFEKVIALMCTYFYCHP